MNLILIVLAALFMIVGQTFLKLGLSKVGLHSFSGHVIKNIWHVVTQPYVILSVLAFAGNFITWLRVLSQSDLSKSYPAYVGLFMIFLVISSIFLLKETMTVQKIVGITIIFIGVLVVFYKF